VILPALYNIPYYTRIIILKKLYSMYTPNN
jgi:hypothetical protein